MEQARNWSGVGGSEFSVVVPILNPNMAESLVHLAVALAGVNTLSGQEEQRRARVVVLGVVTVPEDTPLSQGANLVKAYRTLLRYIPPESSRLSDRVEVRTEVRVAREVWQGIADQVREEEADLLLLHWKGTTQTPGAIYGATIDALMDDPLCDIVLARLNNLPAVNSILLPVRGGSYSALAMHLVSNMAEQWNASVTVMHNLSQPNINYVPSTEDGYNSFYPSSAVAEDDLNALQNILTELPPNARLLTTQGQLEQSIIREATYNDLLVLGASGRSDISPGVSHDKEARNLAQRVVSEANCPVLVVKTRKPLRLVPSRPVSNAEDDLRESVDRWFAQNTFHYREFRSLSSLTLLKERNNLSISLIFPVYGPTQPLALADAVRRAHYALVHDCALLDEIIISAPGIKLDEQEVAMLKSRLRPETNGGEEIIYLDSEGTDNSGQASGPGEALWHALQAARGDLIVWADPHIVGFEARLFYGLVGPLLSYPEFQMAVGFYSYPSSEDPERTFPIHSNLTELSIRPLLSSLFPLLAGVIDPGLLIGAARRDHLEHLPFFTSSAFTTGLLIDTLPRAGLMSVAQVDLGSQPKYNNPLRPQRVVADLLEILLHRTGERSQTALLKLFSPSLKSVQKIGNVYSLNVEPSPTLQREIPPLAYTPNYHRHSF
jgi:glucosyl-3-phosphoglycerate synthase